MEFSKRKRTLYSVCACPRAYVYAYGHAYVLVRTRCLFLYKGCNEKCWFTVLSPEHATGRAGWGRPCSASSLPHTGKVPVTRRIFPAAGGIWPCFIFAAPHSEQSNEVAARLGTSRWYGSTKTQPPLGYVKLKLVKKNKTMIKNKVFSKSCFSHPSTLPEVSLSRLSLFRFLINILEHKPSQ